MAATVAVLLSARAPRVFDDVSDGVSTRLDQRAPEARDAAERALRRTGVEESDALAHIGLWSGAMLLAGLATWSWGSLAAMVLVVFAGSTGLELVQERLSPTRITEWSDLVANAAGIGIGLALVVVITIVGGLPAHARRWKLRRRVAVCAVLIRNFADRPRSADLTRRDRAQWVTVRVNGRPDCAEESSCRR